MQQAGPPVSAPDRPGPGYAKSHNRSVKSGICAVFRLRYIEVVHTDSPAPPGFPNKTARCSPCPSSASNAPSTASPPPSWWPLAWSPPSVPPASAPDRPGLTSSSGQGPPAGPFSCPPGAWPGHPDTPGPPQAAPAQPHRKWGCGRLRSAPRGGRALG